jgi:glycosyltransferase involved in cell wall biosynthesis
MKGPKMTTEAPLVSIIIPTYCEEKNIEWCLKSIKKQTFNKSHIETIIVDSNSPDNTRTIAKKYTDKVINIKERGVSKARNIGAQKAKGRVLLFLDADTILDPEFVAKMYHSFTDPSVVCISGALIGLERRGIIDNLFKLFHYNFVNEIAALTARLGFPLFPTVCCACRKAVFDEIGGFDEGLAIAEDLTFSLKIGKVGKCLLNKKAKAYTSLRRVEKNGRMKNYFIYFRNYFRVFALNQKPWIGDFPHTQET